MKVEDKTMMALQKALKFRQLRQEIISSNIANANTPGYKAKRVQFEQALARALDVDGNLAMNVNDERHYDVGSGGFANLEPEIIQDPNGEVNENGNTVSMEDEVALMNENKLMYDATVQLLNKKLGLLKYAITSER